MEAAHAPGSHLVFVGTRSDVAGRWSRAVRGDRRSVRATNACAGDSEAGSPHGRSPREGAAEPPPDRPDAVSQQGSRFQRALMLSSVRHGQVRIANAVQESGTTPQICAAPG